jgi:hypothetical protein
MGRAISRTLLVSIIALALASSVILAANACNVCSWLQDTRTVWCYRSPYYYCLTSNFEGIDEIPINSNVIATAATNDPRIDKIKFVWINPANQEFAETVPVTSVLDGAGQNYCYNSQTVRAATSERTLDKEGSWVVRACFIDEKGFCWFHYDKVIARRCIRLFVIPEIPLMGTLGASASMLAGLFAFKVRKKRNK